jgi:hypothetical protein
MSSLNYAAFGQRFSLEGAFRVLRKTDFPSEPLYYDEVVDCGTVTSETELRALVAQANCLRMADFGNGLRGIYGECADFNFCVVPAPEHRAITDPKPVCHTEESDKEEGIF